MPPDSQAVMSGDNETTPDQPPTVQGSQMTGTSTMKRNLQEAMKAAAEIGKTQDSRLTELMNDFAKGYDTRSVIFGTFYRCGFDLHDLQPVEKQLMEIIQLYPYLKNGEIWRDVSEEFGQANLKPTSDDKHWMDTCIEESLEQTEAAIYEQKVLAADMRSKQQEDLDRYYAAIRLKNELNSQQKGTGRQASKKPADK